MSASFVAEDPEVSRFMITRLKSVAPWQLKILLKLAIGRLPVPHRVWVKLGIFVHGARTPGEYVDLVLRHRAASPLERDFTVLELGPGESAASALVMAAAGARRTYLSDVGRFAAEDPAAYAATAAALRERGLEPVDPAAHATLDDLLAACRAEYLTGGLADLRRIPTGSVDLIWSHAVFEHVRLTELPALLAELRRVSSHRSISSHAIDLKDHLSGGLHNLRFARRVWESMAWAGFYTNRLRRQEFLEAFRRAGFRVEREATTSWTDVRFTVTAID